MQSVDGRLLFILFLGTGSPKASSVPYYKMSSLEAECFVLLARVSAAVGYGAKDIIVNMKAELP